MSRTERLLLEAVFMLVLLAFSAAFYRIMQPFLLTTFLALVLANIFRAPYVAIRDRVGGRRRLAAAAAILLVFLVVAIPVSIVAMLVTSELISAVGNIRNNWGEIQRMVALPQIVDALEDLPVIGPLLAEMPQGDIASSVRQAITSAGDYLVRLSRQSIGNVGLAVANFALMLLLMFFFFSDGERIVKRLYAAIPMKNADIDEIVGETFSTTSATLISTLIIGLLEGTMATVLFAVFGLPSPFLWGVITMVLSMIPIVGTNFVVIPAGIITAVGGQPLAGLVIAVGGFAGVMVTQNVVKPRLLGDRTGLHPAIALLSTLGGIAWLGLIGFLIGPVLASLFIVVWKQFAARYQRLMEGKNAAMAHDEGAEEN